MKNFQWEHVHSMNDAVQMIEETLDQLISDVHSDNFIQIYFFLNIVITHFSLVLL